MDPRDRLVHLLLREVAEHDRHLEPAQDEERELSRHEPGADDARPAATRRGSASGCPTPRFARRSTRSNAYTDACACGPGEELRERVLLGPIALLERPRRRALDQVERAVGRGSAAVHLAVEPRRALRQTSATSERSALGPTLPAPSSIFPRRNASDSSRNSTGVEQRVREPGLEAFGPLEHPVLAQRVLDDERHRLLRADELRDELRPAPARDEAEEDLRAREVADRADEIVR